MKKVITYGTYDLFHEGHRRLLARAKELGDYLIVGVTSDSFDRERGKLNVRDSLAARIDAVRASGFADEIIVEEYIGQKINDIVRFGVDIFVIGSDWKGKFDYLARYCEVVYLDRTKGVSSTDLRNDDVKMLRLGIVSDSMDDGGICGESYFVSGLETTGVYMPMKDDDGKKWIPDKVGADAFVSRYDLGCVFGSMQELNASNDVVYIHTRRRYRFEFAALAIEAGKHVICDFPLNKPEETEEIYRLIKDRGLLFAECVPLAYLRTFQQLIWLLHGGAIGKALSVECAMPARFDFRDSEALAAFAITRILGSEGANVTRLSIRARERYDKVAYVYADAAASCAVSDSEWLTPGMTILGTDGRIDVPGEWWNMHYFKLNTGGEGGVRRYSFNSDGSGLRYLLSEATQMISEGRTEATWLSNEDARELARLLERGDLL